MMKNSLVEVKRGETGTGLLIENDGYISMHEGKNKTLFEDIHTHGDNDSEFHCPYPFVVSAVFQKYGIKNANGRIYPENVLKREVERYQDKIREKRALGECYRPTAKILTETGWKQLSEIQAGENVLTLNPETNDIELQPVLNVIKHEHDGNMIHIKGRNIDELVTPEHGFPLYDRNNCFKKFIEAKELLNGNSHFYIPKTGNWIGRNDKTFVIPSIKNFSKNTPKDLIEKYSNDLEIPMEIFAKFMGIYLSEGCCDKSGTKYRVMIAQKKPDVCEEIEKMLEEFGLKFTINERKDKAKTFVICDMRLNLYLRQFGLCYDKFIPWELKQQNSKILELFYNWFVLGDGRIRGDKRRMKKEQLTSDVFSTSERLALDLNEVILKIGYSSTFHKEDRDNERIIENRVIKSENTHPLYFAYKSLTKGIYCDSRFLTVEEEYYKGDVMCVEVPNHIWYVMENGKCHWTKNCNHPAEPVIDLSRVAINITELHWEGQTLLGEMEVLITEGFRKHGIVSTCGDEVANLLLKGVKIGVSSRGLGTVTQRDGILYVADDFEIVCWDVVSDPSTPNAWIASSREKLQPYVESKSTNKHIVSEKIEKIEELLKDF